MRILPAVLANCCLIVSALGFGNLLRPLFSKGFFLVDRIALTLLGGLGILGTLLFCIGQIWFTRKAILLVLGVGIVLSIMPISRLFRSRCQFLTELRPPALPLIIISVLLLVTVVGGLALPVGDMNNDSIAYHYLGPTVWLRHGIVRAVPDEVLTYFPVVVETQYAALMSIGGQRAPQFFSTISFALLLLMGAVVAIQMGLSHSEVWWAMAVIAAMPAVYRGVYGGMVDALFAAFLLAAARVAFDAEHPKDFALFGIFCGIAVGTKYTGILAAMILVFCRLTFAVRAKARSSKVTLKYLGLSALIAVVVASPFYLRNWLFYGCPVYPPPPGLLRFFPSTQILPGVMKELLKNVRETGAGMGGSLIDFLLLPFNLTYHAANFRGAGGIGLLPFALGPFGLFAKRWDAFSMAMAFFAVLETSVWFLTAQVSRYLIPAYVIAAIFGVLGWQYVANNAPKYGRALASTAVAISVIYGGFMVIQERRDDLHAAFSSTFEAARRQREIPRIESFDYINREPSVQRILVLNCGIAAYFIEKDYVKPFGRWGERTLVDAETVTEVMAQLPKLHVTHVLDVKSESGQFDLPENPPGLRKVFQQGEDRIYSVEQTDVSR
jgi:hypothetical protein